MLPPSDHRFDFAADRIVTRLAPDLRASQAAAIRVPFPDISAIEPSGFQMRSLPVLRRGRDLEDPSEPTPSLVAQPPHAVGCQRLRRSARSTSR